MWPAIRELMDQLPEAIVVLDAEDRVVLANQFAEQRSRAPNDPTVGDDPLVRVLKAFATNFTSSSNLGRGLHQYSSDIPTFACLRSASRYYYVGPQFERIFGVSPDPLYYNASAILEVCHPDDDEAVRAKIQAGPGPDPLEFEFRIIRPDSSLRWLHVRSVPLVDQQSQELLWACFCEDVTTLRSHSLPISEKLLVDLQTFESNIQWTALHCARSTHHHPFAVAILDIVGFRALNERLGFLTGDQLLGQFIHRLLAKLVPGDCLTQLGGDRVALLLNNPDQRLQPLLQSLQEPFSSDALRIQLAVRCGVAFPEDDPHSANLLRTASHAHQLARDRRASLLLGTPTKRLAPSYPSSLEYELSLAMDRDEFFFEFQPVFDPHTGVVKMIEALLRWRHPRLGIISPAKFMAAAEDSGLVLRLDMLGLNRLADHIRTWSHESPGIHDVPFSLNISGRHFPNFDCEQQFLDTLREPFLRRSRVVFEITESVFVESVPNTIAGLQRLRAEGVAIWLDDFGDGYSSLRYLSSFPVDGIKVSEHFVRTAVGNAKSRVILSSIVSLARGMGMQLVAEGVESQSQFDLLVSLGFDAIQGFLLSRPIPASDVPSLLRRPEARPVVLARSA
jgi:PAS domain S-box-containing protein